MSIQNTLVKALMRLTNYKGKGDRLSFEERQQENFREPPVSVSRKFNCQTLEIDGARAIWLAKENAKNGVMVYLHGGAYVVGPYKVQWEYLADMCGKTGMAGLLIDYRLAPQNPFPAALNDVVAILTTLCEKRELPQNWFLLGDSAGAGLAVASCWKLKESDTGLPKKLILMSGWFDLTLENPEIQQNSREDPMLSFDRLLEAGKAYAAGEEAKNPLISPAFGDLRGLPPVLIQIGTLDLLVWDNRRFYQKCVAAGVQVQYEEFPATFHAFMMLSLLPEARRARKSQVGFLLN